MAGAVAAARELKQGQRCVVILPDSIRNYMTKHLSDDWLQKGGYVDQAEAKAQQDKVDSEWKGATIADLKLPSAITVKPEVFVMLSHTLDIVQATCDEARCIMQKHGFDQLPVVHVDGKVMGIISLGTLLSKGARGIVARNDPISKSMYIFERGNSYLKITPDTPLSSLSVFFQTHSAAFVTDEHMRILSVVTKIDLLNHLFAAKAVVDGA